MGNEDTKEIYNENLDSYVIESRQKDAVTIEKYILNINLIGNKGSCDGFNNLILDNAGKRYKVDYDKIKVNGIDCAMDFNVRGTYTDIYAQYSDVTLSLEMTDSTDKDKQELIETKDDEERGKKNPKKVRVRNVDKCSDTPDGFKLSQIMDTLGDMEKIKNNTNEENRNVNNGNIYFNQYAVKYSTNNREFIIFKFIIQNIGNRIAQKIGFKDIFPDNIKVHKDKIFLNNIAIGENKAILKNNQLRILIGNLSSSMSAEIVIVGELVGCCCNAINTGCLFYVSTSYYKRGKKKEKELGESEEIRSEYKEGTLEKGIEKQGKKKTKVINVVQKMSNSKDVSNV